MADEAKALYTVQEFETDLMTLQPSEVITVGSVFDTDSGDVLVIRGEAEGTGTRPVIEQTIKGETTSLSVDEAREALLHSPVFGGTATQISHEYSELDLDTIWEQAQAAVEDYVPTAEDRLNGQIEQMLDDLKDTGEDPFIESGDLTEEEVTERKELIGEMNNLRVELVEMLRPINLAMGELKSALAPYEVAAAAYRAELLPHVAAASGLAKSLVEVDKRGMDLGEPITESGYQDWEADFEKYEKTIEQIEEVASDVNFDEDIQKPIDEIRDVLGANNRPESATDPLLPSPGLVSQETTVLAMVQEIGAYLHEPTDKLKEKLGEFKEKVAVCKEETADMTSRAEKTLQSLDRNPFADNMVARVVSDYNAYLAEVRHTELGSIEIEDGNYYVVVDDSDLEPSLVPLYHDPSLDGVLSGPESNEPGLIDVEDIRSRAMRSAFTNPVVLDKRGWERVDSRLLGGDKNAIADSFRFDTQVAEQKEVVEKAHEEGLSIEGATEKRNEEKAEAREIAKVEDLKNRGYGDLAVTDKRPEGYLRESRVEARYYGQVARFRSSPSGGVEIYNRSSGDWESVNRISPEKEADLRRQTDAKLGAITKDSTDEQKQKWNAEYGAHKDALISRLDRILDDVKGYIHIIESFGLPVHKQAGHIVIERAKLEICYALAEYERLGGPIGAGQIVEKGISVMDLYNARQDYIRADVLAGWVMDIVAKYDDRRMGIYAEKVENGEYSAAFNELFAADGSKVELGVYSHMSPEIFRGIRNGIQWAVALPIITQVCMANPFGLVVLGVWAVDKFVRPLIEAKITYDRLEYGVDKGIEQKYGEDVTSAKTEKIVAEHAEQLANDEQPTLEGAVEGNGSEPATGEASPTEEKAGDQVGTNENEPTEAAEQKGETAAEENAEEVDAEEVEETVEETEEEPPVAEDGEQPAEEEPVAEESEDPTAEEVEEPTVAEEPEEVSTEEEETEEEAAAAEELEEEVAESETEPEAEPDKVEEVAEGEEDQTGEEVTEEGVEEEGGSVDEPAIEEPETAEETVAEEGVLETEEEEQPPVEEEPREIEEEPREEPVVEEVGGNEDAEIKEEAMAASEITKAPAETEEAAEEEKEVEVIPEPEAEEAPVAEEETESVDGAPEEAPTAKEDAEQLMRDGLQAASLQETVDESIEQETARMEAEGLEAEEQGATEVPEEQPTAEEPMVVDGEAVIEAEGDVPEDVIPEMEIDQGIMTEFFEQIPTGLMEVSEVFQTVNSMLADGNTFSIDQAIDAWVNVYADTVERGMPTEGLIQAAAELVDYAGDNEAEYMAKLDSALTDAGFSPEQVVDVNESVREIGVEVKGATAEEPVIQPSDGLEVSLNGEATDTFTGETPDLELLAEGAEPMEVTAAETEQMAEDSEQVMERAADLAVEELSKGEEGISQEDLDNLTARMYLNGMEAKSETPEADIQSPEFAEEMKKGIEQEQQPVAAEEPDPIAGPVEAGTMPEEAGFIGEEESVIVGGVEFTD